MLDTDDCMAGPDSNIPPRGISQLAGFTSHIKSTTKEVSNSNIHMYFASISTHGNSRAKLSNLTSASKNIQ